MKVPISTEGRIFTAQLTRDLNAREAAGAGLLCPGKKTWREAVRGAGEAMTRKMRGPIQAGAAFQKMRKQLIEAHKNGACFVNGWYHGKRSGIIELLVYHVDTHPLTPGTGNEGVLIERHILMLRRNGVFEVNYGDTVAFMSWHALGRMHERNRDVDIFTGQQIAALCGLAGMLMRESAKHLNTELNVVMKKLIVTGALRSAIQEGRSSPYAFFDVLTCLELPELSEHVLVRDTPPKVMQGMLIEHAVECYLKAGNADTDPAKYASKIPILPFTQSDFVTRTMRRQA